ncbi:polysaccharide deacetylase family protein [Pontibacter chitinilyticus]|uniref:polysaccharide deacetylase family protein n=1 Tax=Pontibacter chitinilyticus TaxID=2674989 RepID=UPI00321B4CAE
MRTKLRALLKKYFEHQALVLMYHRVAMPASDIWGIAVSPENFEQHLQVLQKTKKVIPVKQLVEDIRNGYVRKNSVAITFDDGYVDNFTVAKPLLEKYKLPATFFITSGNLGQQAEFWWDELEYLILFSARLPRQFSMSINGNDISFDLQQEAELDEALRQKNSNWDACKDAPPTVRAALFLEVWQHLKPLPHTLQQEMLQRIRAWAGASVSAREDFRSMTEAQLKRLSKHRLFDVGAHTVSHPALAFHDKAYQQQELLENARLLKQVTSVKAAVLAYPYGNYNNVTATIAAEIGFAAAFTTEEKPVTRHSPRFRLGRIQAPNCSGPEFAALLNKPFK